MKELDVSGVGGDWRGGRRGQTRQKMVVVAFQATMGEGGERKEKQGLLLG